MPRETSKRPTILSAWTYDKLGTQMPAWRFVLTEQGPAKVSEYLILRLDPNRPQGRQDGQMWS